MALRTQFILAAHLAQTRSYQLAEKRRSMERLYDTEII
jgi:hypothetical protein